HGDAVESELRGETAEPFGVEPHVDQRAERHVAGDTAERVENRDAHQMRYDAPLPVLKINTSALGGMRFAATSSAVTLSAHPPSGAVSTPLMRDSFVVPSRIASSLTACASPLLSFSARR